MNRRNFLTSIITASAGFSILPSAMTYARTWKPTRLTQKDLDDAVKVFMNPEIGDVFEYQLVLGNNVYKFNSNSFIEKDEIILSPS